jgi:hypothetical protein
MLKLHHMNLLNEIQETTLMMNLYQQQQLQQQQQQLQQQAGVELNGDPQMAMLLQQQQQGGMVDPMFGAAQLQQQQRASLGLGASQLAANYGGQQVQMLKQQQRDIMAQGNVKTLSAISQLQEGDSPVKDESKNKGDSPAGGDASEKKRPVEDVSMEKSSAKRAKPDDEVQEDTKDEDEE